MEVAGSGYSKEEIKRLIYEELPRIIKEHPEVKVELWNILSGVFAPKEETEDRFEKLLKEIQRQREEANKRFEEHQRRFDEYQKRFEEHDRKFNALWAEVRALREEANRRFEEHQKRFEEHDKKFNTLWSEVRALREEANKRFEEHDKKFNALWAEVRALREESNRRFEEHQKRFEEMLNEIRRVDRRIDRTIGALGARWGISTEHVFREAIKSVIEDITGLKVERYLKYDTEGKVFGRPDQVELDLVIHDGMVWIMEIKSSISKPEVYAFSKKVEFYREKKGEEVKRRIIVSPMIEPSAMEIIEDLGIEYFTYPEDMDQKVSG